MNYTKIIPWVLIPIVALVVGIGTRYLMPPVQVKVIQEKEVEVKKEVIKEVRIKQEGTVIGENCSIDGKITVDQVTIEGKVTGNVDIKNKIHVGKTGEVQAEIKAANVLVEGKVTGNITSEQVVINSTADIDGDIQAKGLTFNDGARYSGKLNINPTGVVTKKPEIKEIKETKVEAKPIERKDLEKVFDEPKKKVEKKEQSNTQIIINVPKETTKETKNNTEGISLPNPLPSALAMHKVEMKQIKDTKVEEVVKTIEQKAPVVLNSFSAINIIDLANMVVKKEMGVEYMKLLKETRIKYNSWNEENKADFSTYMNSTVLGLASSALDGDINKIKKVFLYVAMYQDFSDLPPSQIMAISTEHKEEFDSMCKNFSWEKVSNLIKGSK
jgi:cytoskeletal protein CcmA (bactofilin family)